MAADIDGAVIVGGPVTGSGGAEHGLHVLAEAGSQRLAVGAKDEGGEVADLLGDVNVLDVEFVAEQVGERLEGRRVATGDRDRRERETNAKTLILAKAKAGGGDVAQTVHRSDEAGLVAVGRGGGPCRQVHRRGHGVVAVAQSRPDLLGDHRKERRCDLGQRHEHGEERVESGEIGAAFTRTPEAVAAAADVPVVEGVDERLDLHGGAGEVVVVHVRLDRGDEVAGLGEDVAVEQIGVGSRVGCECRSVAFDVRVQREERVGVPDRQDHLTHDIVDRLIGDSCIAATHDVGGHEVPPQGVGALVLEDQLWLGVVAELLRELGAVVGEQDPVTDDVLERRTVEQRRGEHVERVEPAPRLVDVFDDEVGREVFVEPVLVLERVVHLGERHRARLEPAVEDLGHAAHHRRAGRVVGVGAHEFVDVGAMQVGRADAEVGLEFVEAAVAVHARIVGVVADPHGDR